MWVGGADTSAGYKTKLLTIVIGSGLPMFRVISVNL